jgi:hypothetical protein
MRANVARVPRPRRGVVEATTLAPRGRARTRAAEAGAGVEHEVAGLHAELIEADRQQLQPSVPAQLVDVVRHRQHLAVLVDGQLAQWRQLQRSTPAAAGVADAGAQLGVVEAAADRRERASTSPARHCSTVSPSRPVTSGSAPPSVGHEAGARGHRLDRREAEALVQAGHDGSSASA